MTAFLLKMRKKKKTYYIQVTKKIFTVLYWLFKKQNLKLLEAHWKSERTQAEKDYLQVEKI